MQNSVVKNILKRKVNQLPLDDGRKIVLVLNGGLMAGVAGAAALRAMEKLRLSKCFDAIYSASIGFINGIFFLAEDMDKCMDMYLLDHTNKRFANPWRIWKPVNLNVPRESFLESACQTWIKYLHPRPNYTPGF